MAIAIEAALARTACALSSITDLIEVVNLNPQDCTFDVKPRDALDLGKRFSDLGIQDWQMEFFKGRLATCCPESTVRTAIKRWPVLPASLEIREVVRMLEALLLEIQGWNGQCMPSDCAADCGKKPS